MSGSFAVNQLIWDELAIALNKAYAAEPNLLEQRNVNPGFVAARAARSMRRLLEIAR